MENSRREIKVPFHRCPDFTAQLWAATVNAEGMVPGALLLCREAAVDLLTDQGSSQNRKEEGREATEMAAGPRAKQETRGQGWKLEGATEAAIKLQ